MRRKENPRDFPGGPGVKTPCAQCWGVGLIPGQGMPHGQTDSHLQAWEVAQDNDNDQGRPG